MYSKYIAWGLLGLTIYESTTLHGLASFQPHPHVGSYAAEMVMPPSGVSFGSGYFQGSGYLR